MEDVSPLQYLYAGVLLLSLVLVVFAVIFGGDHDTSADGGLDHEHDTGHEVTTDLGDAPSWLSTKVILAGFAGFGAFGLGAYALDLSGLVTLPIAIAGYAVLAVGVRQLVLVPMSRQQSNLLTSREDYKNQRGIVVEVSIRPDNSGYVRLYDKNNTPVKEEAKSYSNQAIPLGIDVIVIKVTPSYLLVDPTPQYLLDTQSTPDPSTDTF